MSTLSINADTHIEHKLISLRCGPTVQCKVIGNGRGNHSYVGIQTKSMFVQMALPLTILKNILTG